MVTRPVKNQNCHFIRAVNLFFPSFSIIHGFTQFHVSILPQLFSSFSFSPPSLIFRIKMENNMERDKLRLSDQKGNWEIWDAFCHKIKKKRERERLNTKGGQKKFEVYRIGSNQRHGSWCLTIPRVCRDVSSSLRFGRSVFYLYGGGKKREKEREEKRKERKKKKEK